MERTAIISVDGHVRASRSDYRDYIEQRYLDAFDEWIRSQEAAGAPESGNQPGLDPTSQWDSELRLKDMESQGVVAEVLFPNGLPFQSRPPTTSGPFSDPELDRQARLAYNRWLADFCAQTPGRRAGQALVSFDDVDLAVARRPLGQGARAGRRHDAGPAARWHLLLRPRPRPGVGRLRGGRPADQPARRVRRAGLRPAGVRRHHDVGARALLLLGPVPVADDPGRRLRALPRPPGRLRRDRGRLDRPRPSASWTAA